MKLVPKVQKQSMTTVRRVVDDMTAFRHFDSTSKNFTAENIEKIVKMKEVPMYSIAC
jgi:hypothetical protein